MTATITTNYKNEKAIRLDIAEKFGKNVFFGTRKSDGARIYLSLPTFNCGWYWGFGYLGNRNEHYHLDGYQSKSHCFTDENGIYKVLTEKRNINMVDALEEDYELAKPIKDNIWKFCEIALTIYALKQSAEVFGRGGSHMTTNPCQKVVKRPHYVKQINEKMIPELCTELFNLFLPKTK